MARTTGTNTATRKATTPRTRGSRAPGKGKGGKRKTRKHVSDIASSGRMIITINAEGNIESVEGGGHTKKMTEAEFEFETSFLDLENDEGSRVTKLLDMKSYTVLILELQNAKGESEVKKYVWESSRHWW